MIKGATLQKLSFGALCIVLILGAYHVFASRTAVVYDVGDPEEVLGEEIQEEPIKQEGVLHIETPESVKAIYMSQCVVGTPSFRDKLVDLIETTELNSVMIDIKDFSGKLAFTTDNPILAPSVSDACGARDMKDFIERLHEKDIYVIGRITVFQDPYYTSVYPELAVKRASDGGVWEDRNGLSFIDVSARDFWEYIVEIAKESYEIGFDELNFDYVRFPSDGNMKDIAFPWSDPIIATYPDTGKQRALEDFFAYLYEALSDENVYPDGKRPVLSADLFGMTTTNTDDLNIGQVLERALPYFDYIMPMVYPSHYPTGFNGWENPNGLPYEVIKYSMDEAVSRVHALTDARSSTSTDPHTKEAKRLLESGHKTFSPLQLRPWLQDFDLGPPRYTAEHVRAQIDATYDAGLTSWALWDAGNTYTKEALLTALPVE